MNVAFFVLFSLGFVAAEAVPQGRIVGGSLATINQYPTIACLLTNRDTAGHFRQNCGGTILNQRHILTAAHCIERDHPAQWRARLGSSFATSGGVLYNIAAFNLHPNYNPRTIDSDIAIMRTSNSISYTNVIQAAQIAGVNYNLRDNERVWAAGWGRISQGGPNSEQLRHVHLEVINQNICNQRYGHFTITNNMLCAGVNDNSNRGQCQMDSGSPLYHNNVVVGVCSFTMICGDPFHPSGNVRVSRFTDWIQRNSLMI
ncbi:trypsin, alkaline C-like [Manduca sexta]|uniref:Peptidase S1 domain-containing protein n=1 Tax=Manduca sexta TaxID=7130 RepID=A0A922CU24_MANSE|nr:trypsin, alkaline C-like [Manduca sexta]KAG6458165.1 hypothetical protein O3G_MSEX010698 [Manduca sexta]KAG6458166.1 hypothetical protein O3G_MSEX010698 [Manduca sexta]